MILRLIPAFQRLFSWRGFAIAYTLVWISLLILAWLSWDSLSMTVKIVASIGLILTTPAFDDWGKSQ